MLLHYKTINMQDANKDSGEHPFIFVLHFSPKNVAKNMKIW